MNYSIYTCWWTSSKQSFIKTFERAIIEKIGLNTFLNTYYTHIWWMITSTSRNQPKCNHSIYNYMRLVVVCDWIWEHLQLQNQISTILVILTTMMQLLKFSSYWLNRFYIHFHPLIGWYVPLVEVVTKLVAS